MPNFWNRRLGVGKATSYNVSNKNEEALSVKANRLLDWTVHCCLSL